MLSQARWCGLVVVFVGAVDTELRTVLDCGVSSLRAMDPCGRRLKSPTKDTKCVVGAFLAASMSAVRKRLTAFIDCCESPWLCAFQTVHD